MAPCVIWHGVGDVRRGALGGGSTGGYRGGRVPCRHPRPRLRLRPPGESPGLAFRHPPLPGCQGDPALSPASKPPVSRFRYNRRDHRLRGRDQDHQLVRLAVWWSGDRWARKNDLAGRGTSNNRHAHGSQPMPIQGRHSSGSAMHRIRFPGSHIKFPVQALRQTISERQLIGRI